MWKCDAVAARPSESVVYVSGPWAHRDVYANGSRFHVVEAGTGPLVLLLHGFPEFWWSWRHQLAPLAAAGYRAVAIDLRGTGGSDKPPRGYDTETLAADVAGLVGALGEQDATIVGHDTGGAIGWTVATQHPAVVRRLVLLGAAHPRSQRAALRRGRLVRARHILAAQLPRFEHFVTARDAAYTGELLRRWSAPAWVGTDDFAAYTRRCQDAIRIPQASFCALEHYRWLIRSLARPSGWRFTAGLAAGVEAPVLQMHGALDRYVLPSTAAEGGRYANGGYEWRLLPAVGHFPQSESPDQVTAELLAWLADDTPARRTA